MFRALIVTVLAAATLSSVLGDYCYSPRPSTIYKMYQRGTPVFPTVEAAETACDEDAACGAVQVDRIPYRNDDFEVVHSTTVYLIPAAGMTLKNTYGRYVSYTKVDC